MIACACENVKHSRPSAKTHAYMSVKATVRVPTNWGAWNVCSTCARTCFAPWVRRNPLGLADVPAMAAASALGTAVGGLVGNAWFLGARRAAKHSRFRQNPMEVHSYDDRGRLMGRDWHQVVVDELRRKRAYGAVRSDVVVSVRRVALRGDYDRSGRYWGAGLPLFEFETDAGDVEYVRAGDRRQALAGLVAAGFVLRGRSAYNPSRKKDRRRARAAVKDAQVKAAQTKPGWFAGYGGVVECTKCGWEGGPGFLTAKECPSCMASWSAPQSNPADCRRCRGAGQVALGTRMVRCPTCCRKNPQAVWKGGAVEADVITLVESQIEKGLDIVPVGKSSGRVTSAVVRNAKRNPLDSHKPGCRCWYHRKVGA